jgi:hypothetical protein
VSARTDRIGDAVNAIVSVAKTASPNNSETIVELILLSAVQFCVYDLKMSTKDACDAIDVRISALFERFAQITSEKIDKD